MNLNAHSAGGDRVYAAVLLLVLLAAGLAVAAWVVTLVWWLVSAVLGL